MDPIKPNTGPNVTPPKVEAPQTGTPGVPDAGANFAARLNQPAVTPPAAASPGGVSNLQRLTQTIKDAMAQNPAREHVFKTMVESEARNSFGKEVPAEVVSKATSILAESPEMRKLFDRLYQEAAGR